jgi:hypothetical protein
MALRVADAFGAVSALRTHARISGPVSGEGGLRTGSREGERTEDWEE